MQLYGVAVAILPKEDEAYKYKVMCTPIAVDSNDRDNFQVMDNLKFERKIDPFNIQESSDCFADVVKVMSEVVRLQHESCQKKGIEYRPVAVTIGEDSRNRIPLDASYMLMFGKRFSPDDYIEQLIEKDDDVERYYSKDDAEKTYHREQWINHLYSRKSDNKIASILNTRNFFEATVQKALRLRNEHLERSGILPEPFVEACKALEQIIPECTLRRGTYRRGGDEDALLLPSALDEELKRLRPFFRTSKAAFAQIVALAEKTGRIEGLHFTMDKSGNSFGGAVPHGYRDNIKLQEELPRYDFYNWDPAFREAFYQGFNATYKGPYNIHYRLPSDPQNPPFTDPTANMIRDQFEIVEGKRPANRVIDRPEMRQRLLDDAGEIARCNGAHFVENDDRNAMPPLCR